MSDNFDIHQTFTESDGTPLLLAPSTTVADKYTLVECLGRGGMGEAWLAEQIVQRKHESEVAPRFVLKIVPGDVQADAVEMDKVRESYLRIVGLKHANICTLHPLERDDRLGYVLVMEYVPGTTLRQHIHAKPDKKLELDEVVRLLTPVAEALDYAHKKKVIHRDIKPANIMVTPEGETQIIDFGLAAQIRTSMSQISKVRMGTSGTLPYMAPEQWMGEYQDARTDQYALGVVAYELLSGRLPFESAEQFALGFQVMNKPAPPIEGLSDAVNKTLAKAMAKKRKKRFGNCREFVRNLRNALTALPPPKKSPTLISPLDNAEGDWEKQVDAAMHEALQEESESDEPIWNAAINERWNTVKKTLDLGRSHIPVTANDICTNKVTLLRHAAARGDVEFLTYLVSSGANIHSRDQMGQGLLHYAAAYNGNVEVLKYLVSQGVDVNAKAKNGETPLDCAHTEEIKIFLRKAGGHKGAKKQSPPPQPLPPQPPKLDADTKKYTFPDVYPDLQEAIDKTAERGRITIRPGEYRFKNTISLDKTVHIVGDQSDPHAVKFIHLGDDEACITVRSGSPSISFCDITGSMAGTKLENDANPVFTRCFFHHCGDNGIYCHSGTGTFEECEIYKNKDIGVVVYSNPTFRKCKIYGGKKLGIFCSKGTGTFEECEIYDNAFDQVYVLAAASPSFVRCRTRQKEETEFQKFTRQLEDKPENGSCGCLCVILAVVFLIFLFLCMLDH